MYALYLTFISPYTNADVIENGQTNTDKHEFIKYKIYYYKTWHKNNNWKYLWESFCIFKPKFNT